MSKRAIAITRVHCAGADLSRRVRFFIIKLLPQAVPVARGNFFARSIRRQNGTAVWKLSARNAAYHASNPKYDEVLLRTAV